MNHFTEMTYKAILRAEHLYAFVSSEGKGNWKKEERNKKDLIKRLLTL